MPSSSDLNDLLNKGLETGRMNRVWRLAEGKCGTQAASKFSDKLNL